MDRLQMGGRRRQFKLGGFNEFLVPAVQQPRNLAFHHDPPRHPQQPPVLLRRSRAPTHAPPPPRSSSPPRRPARPWYPPPQTHGRATHPASAQNSVASFFEPSVLFPSARIKEAARLPSHLHDTRSLAV